MSGSMPLSPGATGLVDGDAALPEKYDITDIDVDDPISAIVEIDKILRPDIKGINSADDIQTILHYYRTIKHAFYTFEVEFDVTIPETPSHPELIAILHNVKGLVDNKKIELLRRKIYPNRTIALDAAWRGKVHSYLLVVRKFVEDAQLEAPLHDSIMTKLNALAAEIDRTRSRLDAFADVLVGLCEGVSAGAKALTPAVRLFERVVGSLARAQSETPAPSLPAPETLGLPSPESIGQDAPEADDEGA